MTHFSNLILVVFKSIAYLCFEIFTDFFSFYSDFSTPCLGYHFHSFLNYDFFVRTFYCNNFIGIVGEEGNAREIQIDKD